MGRVALNVHEAVRVPGEPPVQGRRSSGFFPDALPRTGRQQEGVEEDEEEQQERTREGKKRGGEGDATQRSAV